jgi:ABC-2 type transport system permease protein
VSTSSVAAQARGLRGNTGSIALRQYAALSRRTLVDTVRQPTSIVPAVLFPLIFMGLSSAALSASTALPGFPPVDSYLEFLVTTTIIQGALFGSISAGSNMAIDIEGGFFERLVASPVSRTSILVGRVAAAALIGFLQAWLFLGVASIFGMRSEGGLLSFVMIAVVAALVAAAFGSFSVAFALRTGSTEAVQGSFPMLFAALFLSSAFFPRNLMSGWFKTVATINPLSHLIEDLRAQIIYGINWSDYFVALGIALGAFVLATALAGMAFRGRLALR